MAEPRRQAQPQDDPSSSVSTQARSKLLAHFLEAATPYLVTGGVALPFAVYLFLVLRPSDIHFAHPYTLWLLLGVAALAYLHFSRDKKRSGTFWFSRINELKRTPQGFWARIHHLPRALRLVAMALLVVAMSRPQRLSVDQSEIEGIDIVVALDVSQSMSERDLSPDRISAAKQVIDRFVAGRQNDRIGLVIFGTQAFTQCPLTLDARAVRNLLSEVRLGLIDGRGTAIGNAIGTALNRLRKSSAKSKILVLVTDGDDNASQLDPLTAAKYAQTLGVKIFTILIGRDVLGADAPPGTDRFGNLLMPSPMRYPVNPKLLEKIAGTTGGTPYLATDTEALDKRFHAILEELDRSKLKSQIPRYHELYTIMALPALMLILFEIILSFTRFRRFP